MRSPLLIPSPRYNLIMVQLSVRGWMGKSRTKDTSEQGSQTLVVLYLGPCCCPHTETLSGQTVQELLGVIGTGSHLWGMRGWKDGGLLDSKLGRLQAFPMKVLVRALTICLAAEPVAMHVAVDIEVILTAWSRWLKAAGAQAHIKDGRNAGEWTGQLVDCQLLFSSPRYGNHSGTWRDKVRRDDYQIP